MKIRAKWRRFLFIFGSVVFSAALFSSCGLQEKGAGPILLGTNIWLGYEPLYLARHLRYYDEDTLRLVEFSSNSETLHAFKNGALDAAALTLDEVLMLVEDGIDIQVILVFDISNGADVLMGRPALSTLKDIKGARIGVENTALGAYMLSRALERAALAHDEVEVVPLEIHEHKSAVFQKKVDAIVTFEPIPSFLLENGWNQLFDSSQIPGEIVDVLVVRTETLRSHRVQLERIVEGWFKALQYLESDPEDARALISSFRNISPEETREALKGIEFPDCKRNLALFNSPEQPLQKTARHLMQTMLDAGLIQTRDLAPPTFNGCLILD